MTCVSCCCMCLQEYFLDDLCELMLSCFVTAMGSAQRPDGGLTLCLQEYFVDDLCELMLYVGQHSPKSLEGLQVEDIMTFMVVFMGSPACLKNPFVRSRISEVCLTALMQTLNCMLSCRHCSGGCVSHSADVRQMLCWFWTAFKNRLDRQLFLLDNPLLDDPCHPARQYPATMLGDPLPANLTTLLCVRLTPQRYVSS